ncbi:cardiolipin synthase [Corynebacterium sp. H78]|uniref:cardiolipin synthase n=1 Tax=Corynebacterium sp. H78 TaxID=3133417 RepID=UPI0030B02ED4
MEEMVRTVLDAAASFGWGQIALLVANYTIIFISLGWVPENRKPSTSTAWLLVILLFPFVGFPLFLLFGSAQITGRRHRIQAQANKLIVERTKHLPDAPAHIDPSSEVISTVRLARKLTGIPAVSAVSHGIYTDFDESLNRMIDVIDAAQRTVHVQMYIFALDDRTEPFVAAIERAHWRGVTVKVLVDPIGSWKYPGYYRLKKRFKKSGVPWHPMLPVSIVQLSWRRFDLRNHRKIVTVDGEIAFMGSMNAIEPPYQRRKNHTIGREWIDTWIELTGEVVFALDAVFAVDWSSEVHTAPEPQQLPRVPAELAATEQDNVVQVLPSGPGYTTEPNLRVFNDLIYSARERLLVVSPYFIPDESMLMALTSASYAGVDVQLYVNEKADQFMVGHAQQSYYHELLNAGVQIYRYPAPTVLHSKFMVVDSDAAVFGSSNLDMRSFGLNYEITLLTMKGPIVDELITIAEEYHDASTQLTKEQWNKRPWTQRYLDSVFRLTSDLQ